MIRAAIAGATGYAGAELVRILAAHPGVEITAITSRQFAGQRFDRIFPALAGRVDLVCEDWPMSASARGRMWSSPHCPTRCRWAWRLPSCAGAAASSTSRRISASTMRRVYEAAYQPHASPSCSPRPSTG
jgi:N-acetyl-gamma-glutamyl-phosphate reductase